MEYYAVINLFNSSTPKLTARVLTEPQDADSMWQPSKELAIYYAQTKLNNMLSALRDSIERAFEQGAVDHLKSVLDSASQLTILTLKLTALVHLAIANDKE